MDLQLHQVQMKILRHLLLNSTDSFSKMAKESKLSTDHFNYHLACLQKTGYIVKDGDRYKLTRTGKEFANRMDTERTVIERQAKLGALLIITKVEKGKEYLLIQKRLKEPYYGFFGFTTGKVGWGEKILETGARELMEEAGLTAKLEYRFTIHEHVYHKDDGRLLEDKFFFIIKGTDPKGKLISLPSGENSWMSMEEFKKLTKVYYDEFELLELLKKGQKELIEKEFWIEEF